MVSVGWIPATAPTATKPAVTHPSNVVIWAAVNWNKTYRDSVGIDIARTCPFRWRAVSSHQESPSCPCLRSIHNCR